MTPSADAFSRRQFLATGAAVSLGAWGTCRAAAGEDAGRSRRAISGDRAEPNWRQRLTVTVGPEGGQLTGADDKVLQAAVDYVARLGGGTVQVLPGTYRLRNAVHLASGVRLLGSGADSVLVKNASTTTRLAANSDWYDQEITLADPKGFELGDGVCLRTKNPHNAGLDVLKRTLVARSGNRFKLDRPLRKNFWLQGESTASNAVSDPQRRGAP